MSPTRICITDEQASLESMATLVAALASLLGSSMMIVGCLLFGKRKGVSRLLVFMAIADWGWALTEVTAYSLIVASPNLYTFPVCFAFRLVFQFFSSATVFWSTSISIFLYRSLVGGTKHGSNSTAYNGVSGEREYIVWYHFFSWGFPVLMCLAVALFGQLKQDPKQLICLPSGNYHMLIWYLPLCIAIAAAIILYAVFLHLLRLRLPVSISTYFMQVPFRISLYVLIFILCWVPNMVFYSLLYIGGFCPPFSLLVTSNVLLQSQGLFDFIVYGLTNRKFRERFYGVTGLAFAAVSPFLVIPIVVIKFYQFCCERNGGQPGSKQSLINSSEYK